MATLVIYHAGCWDGFCAAWLLHRAFSDAEFHAAHYGTEPPDVAGKDVFVVDFSYKRDVMRRILSAARAVVVLDHHKTAEAELAGLVDEFTMRPDLIQNPPGSELPVIHFDMAKSGGRLTWEYLYRRLWSKFEWIYFGDNNEKCDTAHAPWLVNYTEDRDLWRHKLDWSREINAWLRSYPLDFALWDKFVMVSPGCEAWDMRVDAGAAILRSERQMVEEHVRHAREIEMDGHKVLSVNATVLFSDVAGELAKGRPFGACYFDRYDGKRQWSLRSAPDGVDVAEVAKKRGGGGHKHAAGFEEEARLPQS